MKKDFENKAINPVREVFNQRGEYLCTVDFSNVVETLETLGLLIKKEAGNVKDTNTEHGTTDKDRL